MKIAYLFYHFAQKAGTERILINKMNWLADHGYDVYALTYEQGAHPFAFPLSDKVHHIDFNVCFFPLYKCNPFKRLWTTVKRRRQLVMKLREFVSQQRPDAMACTTYAPFEITALTKVCKSLSVPFFIESHSIYAETKKADWLSLILHRNKPFTRDYLSGANRVIALTEGDAKEWRKVTSKVDVIPNMVTFDAAYQHSDLNSQKVIFMGRMEAEKGLSDLLKVWELVHRRCPDWTLHVYGIGSQREWFVNQAEQLNIDICVHEPVPMISEKYCDSSILLLTSTSEAFGLVLVEAMRCGLPVVAFDCPYGPADIITDGADGFLVKNRDVEAFADRVCQLIEDKVLRQKMGKTAIQSAQRYTPERIMPLWKELFESFLS